MRPLDLRLQSISPYDLLTYKNKKKANKQTNKKTLSWWSNLTIEKNEMK